MVPSRLSMALSSASYQKGDVLKSGRLSEGTSAGKAEGGRVGIRISEA